jgi:hypothetical protein
MNRRRSGHLGVLDVVLVAICVATLMWAVVGAASAPASPHIERWSPVLVEEHATVWDLARAHPIRGLTTAETVALIRSHNGLAGAALRVGQSLEVPAEASPAPHVAQR